MQETQTVFLRFINLCDQCMEVAFCHPLERLGKRSYGPLQREACGSRFRGGTHGVGGGHWNTWLPNYLRFCCFCICSCIFCASSSLCCHLDFFLGLFALSIISARTLSSVTTYLRMYHVIIIVMIFDRR